MTRVSLVLVPLLLFAVACSSTSKSVANEACSTIELHVLESVTSSHVTRTRPETHDGATSCTWSTDSGDAIAVTVDAAGSGAKFSSIVDDSVKQFGESKPVAIRGASQAVEFPANGVVEMVVRGRVVTLQQFGFDGAGAVHLQLAESVAGSL